MTGCLRSFVGVATVVVASMLSVCPAVARADDARSIPEGSAGQAGVFPAPAIPGQSVLTPEGAATVRFRFAGVTDDGEQGSSNRKEATSVHCTNFDSVDATIEVQVIQWNGTDVYVGSVVAPPGRTFTFSTQNTTIYFDDVVIGTPAIFQGSGLILSDSNKIQCTAQALDPWTYPPQFMSSLQVVP
jgi:hypothetical protein